MYDLRVPRKRIPANAAIDSASSNSCEPAISGNTAVVVCRSLSAVHNAADSLPAAKTYVPLTRTFANSSLHHSYVYHDFGHQSKLWRYNTSIHDVADATPIESSALDYSIR